jgi:hypothetical protein
LFWRHLPVLGGFSSAFQVNTLYICKLSAFTFCEGGHWYSLFGHRQVSLHLIIYQCFIAMTHDYIPSLSTST